MFNNEVFVSKEDKEVIADYIVKINVVLDKYEYSSDYSQHTVTAMSRAKSAAQEALTWINLLYTN